MLWPIIYKWGILHFGWSNHKLARNVVSFSHATSTTALFFLLSNKWKGYAMIVNSISYFLWDLYYMFYFGMDPVYVLHHLAILGFLWNTDALYWKIMVLFYAEVSNIPTYLVYHRLKMNIPCRSLKLFQAGWFSYFRVYELGILLSRYWKGNFTSWIMFNMYVLGNYWGFQQIKKLLP